MEYVATVEENDVFYFGGLKVSIRGSKLAELGSLLRAQKVGEVATGRDIQWMAWENG